MTVRHRDGVHSDLEGGPVVADARSAVGAVDVVSHAHADHTFRSTPETVVCSTEPAAIAEARTGSGFAFADRAPGVELVATVRAIDSDRVYAHHGFDEAFADVLETEYGYRASAEAKSDDAKRF